jgi:autotransporter-associated beta strand protein
MRPILRKPEVFAMVLLIANLFFSTTSLGQTVNDYRSFQTGNWNLASTWERYDGTTWATVPEVAPTVAGTATSAKTIAGTIHAVALPSGIVNGDLLLIFWADSDFTATAPTLPVGWTQLYTNTSSSGRMIRRTWYKIADGSETTTLNITAGDENSAHTSYRIAVGTFQGIPVALDAGSASSATPNPPSLTPGFSNINTLWIAASHSAGDDNVPFSGPTNYTNLITGYTGISTTTHARVATAVRAFSTLTEDPGNFTLGSTVVNLAATIAIRGASSIPSTPTSSSNDITVRNGHVVTVTAPVNIDQCTIDSGGQVTLNSGIALTIDDGTGTDLTLNGIFSNLSTTAITTTGTISVGASGRFEHRVDGVGTVPTATWDVNSTCAILNWSSSANRPLNLSGQTFGNFVLGPFINGGGTAGTLLPTGGGTITCLGNFTTLNGSGNARPISLSFGSGSGNATLNVAKNFTSTNGTFILNGGTSGTVALNVTGNFSNTGTFTPGTSTVVFDKASGTQTVNRGASSFNAVTHSGAGTLQLLTNSLNASGSFNNSGGGTLDLAGLAATVGDLQGNGVITSSVAAAVTVTAGSNNASTTFSGEIQDGSGAVALTKNGTGTLTLSGNNSYSGATTISAGTIKLGATGTAPNGPLGTTVGGTTVSANAALDLNGFTLDTSEPLTLNGTGVSTNGALTNSSASSVSYSGTIALATASRIGTNTGDITISGVISGTNSLTKGGTGTLTLSGNNTYSGTTTISVGTIKLGATGAAPNGPLGTIAGGTTVSATGATLDLNGFTLDTSEPLTLNGTGISTNGALINSIASLATYSGTIALATASSIGTNIGDIAVSGVISGANTLTKVGPGELTLSGNNTYSGITTINAGTIKLGGTGTAPNGPLGTIAGGTIVSTTGATLDLNGFNLSTLEGLTLNGTGVSTNGALTNSTATAASYSGAIALASASSIGTNIGDITLSGIISGANNLTKVGAGTLILTAANTYSGTTAITTGELRLNPTADVTPNTQIILNGGKLSTTGITLGRTIINSSTLDLSANSSIDLGSGNHTLKFADSSTIPWTGTTLTITGWVGTPGVESTGGKLFFGGTVGTLTPAQLGTISFTGYAGAAMLLSTGELIPQPTVPNLSVAGTLDHGIYCDGTAATAITYTITNVGVAAEGVTVTSNDSQFVVSSLSSITIGSFDSIDNTETFQVIFTPNSGGPKSATITVASTTAGSVPVDIIITGTGVAHPTPTAGGSQTICSSGTATVTGASSPIGTILWTHNGNGTLSGETTLSPIYTPTVDDVGTTVTLTMTVTNSPCPPVSVTYSVNVDQGPSVDAGTDRIVCSTSPNVSLGGTFDAAPAGAIWTTSGSGSFVDATDPGTTYEPSIDDITAGTVILTLATVDPYNDPINFPCSVSISDSMTLDIYAAPTAEAGLNQTICAGSIVDLEAVITGTDTAPLAWTSSGTGVFGSLTSAITTYTPSGADITAGSVTLTITTHNPVGDCNLATDFIVVTINQAAIVEAGDAQTVCSSLPAVTLAGSIGGSATMATWSGGGGIFTPNETTLNATYTPTDDEILAGTVTLTLTTDDPTGICPFVTDTVVITINAAAKANAGPDQTICAGDSVVLNDVAISISGTGITSLTWSTSGTGSFVPNATTLNATYTSSAADETAGSITLTLTTNTPSAPCSVAESDFMVVTINPLATVNADPNNVVKTVCANGSITLDGAIGGGATSATWSAPSGTFGDASSLTSTYTPSIASGTVVLTLTTNDPDGPCSSVTSTMTVTVNPIPITTSVSVCVGGSGSLSSSVCAPGATTSMGPKAAGNGSASGTIAWADPSNIVSDNSIYATAFLTVTGANTIATTGTLQGTEFGFEIPSSATINGIQVSIKRFSSDNATNNTVKDNVISLIKGGVVIGANRANAGNWATANTTVFPYGSNSDLWGTTWTPDQINDPNFGISLSANINAAAFGSATTTASVDYMQITVTYTLNGLNWYTTSSAVSPIGSGTPFNPVGVLNSGLANTNTPGTTTFYAECVSVPGCRAATDFTINPFPVLTCPSDFSVFVNSTPTTFPLPEGSPTGGTYSGAGVSNNEFNPVNAGVGSHTIAYTYSENGCQSTCTFIITVNPPIVISGCPGSIVTVNTGIENANCSQVATWDPITADSFYPLTLVTSHNSGDTFPVGDTVVTYTFTNENGDTATCTFTVRVVDNTLPVVNTQNITIPLSDLGDASITAAQIDNSSSDNCGIQSMSVSPNTFNCTNIGPNTVTLTVTDIHGNVNAAPATVTVQDVTDPVIINMPIDKTVILAANTCTKQVGWTKPTATDACGAVIPISDNADFEEFGSTTLSAGVHTITYTATDASGNSSSASFTVTVKDEIVPTITGCPVVAPVNAVAGTCGARVFYLAPTASDNCTGVSMSINNNDYLSGNIFPVGTTAVIYTAKDASNNTVTCTINVTVNDVEPPTIATLAGMSVNADSGVCTYDSSQLIPPAATDICSAVSVVASPTSLILGANTVTWTATDASENSVTSIQIVTVIDNQDPTITAPAAVSVNSDSGLCTASGVALGTPITADNCSSSVTNDAVEPFASGDTTVTWTVTDGSGNTATATQIVTVIDDQDPTITAPIADSNVNTDPGFCTYTSSLLTPPSATDNCSILSIVASPESLDLGPNTVTWTATDAGGNTATETQIVIVTDNEIPVIVDTPSNITQSNDSGECSAVVTWIPASVTDNCVGSTIDSDYHSGDVFPVGTTTVTYTAIDAASNNAVSTSFTVTVTSVVTIEPFSPATSTRCIGAGTDTITTTATNNVTPIVYSLDAASSTGGNSINPSTGEITYDATWSGPITITATVDGCSDSVSTTHVVTVTPLVTIDAFVPETATRCQGAATVMTITYATNSTGITYSLDATTAAFAGNSIVEETGAVTYAAGWAGTTIITASAAGCEGPVTTDLTVTVTPTVSVDAFLPATSTRCQEAATVITTTNAVNSSGITYSLDATTAAFAGNSIIAETGAVTYAAGWAGTTIITASAEGCNGPVTTTHEVTTTQKPADDITTATICSGDTYIWPANGQSYTISQTGLTIPHDGCIANEVLNLTVTPKPDDNVTIATICSGETYTWAANNVGYTTSQTGLTIPHDGCTANEVLNLTVTPKPGDIITTATICSGETYIWSANGLSYTTSQTGLTIPHDGCTANEVLNLIVTPKPEDIITTATICSGETYIWLANGQSYTTSQSGTTIPHDGCTANEVLNLTVTPKPADDVTTATICSGETYTWAANGLGYTTSQSGTTIPHDGCTANEVLNLTVTPKPADIVTTATICSGHTYTWAANSTGYTTSQTGTTIVNNGCTANEVLNLNVTPTVTILAFSPATSTRCKAAGNETYSTTASNNSAAIVYSLDAASITGGNTINATTGTVTYAATWTGTTTITASAAGCNGPATTAHVATTGNASASFTASIATSSPSAFCSGLTLIANASVAGSYSYLWSPGGATTQSITLYNSATAGTYTVTVTKTDGCSGTTSAQANYNFQPQNVINDYSILGFTDVNLGDRNFVQTGSVGVTTSFGYAKIGTNSTVDGPGGFVKARFITVQSGSNVPARIYSPATVVLPTMQVNTSSTTGLSDLIIPNNTTVTKVGNYKNVTIGTNCNVTFTTGTIFGTVTIGKSSQVKFNANSTGILNVQSINISSGTDPAPSKLIFGSDISVRVKTTVTIGKSSVVNPTGGYKAVFYIGGNEFRVLPGGNATVNASVFAPNGTIRIEGDAVKNTYMKGAYIASRVVSTYKNIYWNQFDCLNPGAKTNSMDNIATKEVEPLHSQEAVSFDVKAYPNPTNYQFTIEVVGGSSEKVEMNLFDIQGRSIKHIESVDNQPIIFGEELPAGTYIAIVYQGANKKSLKLIKK